MNVSRRLFLIGSAAAVATAAVGLPAAAEPIFIAPLKRAVGRLAVYDISINPHAPEIMSELGRWSVYRSSGSPELPLLIGRGLFRWRSMPGEEIYIPENDALKILWEPDPGNSATIDVFYKDQSNEHFCDRFEWRDGVATVVNSYPIDVSPSTYEEDSEDFDDDALDVWEYDT